MPFEVRYLSDPVAAALLWRSGSVLGVVGYGTRRPDDLPLTCPFVAAPLRPLRGDAMFEVWLSGEPASPFQEGPVIGTCGGNFSFGSVTIEEGEYASLEDAVEAAYRQIFDFLDKHGSHFPLRFWNYLSSITEDDHGLQRYMRFNTGRHRAFAAQLRQSVPPAASGVGGDHGASVIYFLAAREAATSIENPRQISAYAYPPAYGPTSPSFSRASVYATDAAKLLFISGTASIVGHETRHQGDLSGQIGETLENLKVLIKQAEETAASSLADRWALKIYLRDAADRLDVDAAVIAMFGSNSQRLYLLGGICRSDLLLEIEVFNRIGAA